MNNKRRRRRSTPIENHSKKRKAPRFWKIIWAIAGLLLFMIITSFTGFYAPDIYMLLIFGVIIIGLNLFLIYTLFKERKNEG